MTDDHGRHRPRPTLERLPEVAPRLPATRPGCTIRLLPATRPGRVIRTPPTRQPGRMVRLLPATLAAVATLFLAPPAAPLHAQAFDVEEATIAEVHAAFLSGDLTCVGLVQAYLARIDAYDQRGPRLNTIATLNPRALDEAARLDNALATDGLTGPLHCIPVLLKDQVETSDMRTTYGSALFEDFVPARDATIVTRMKDAGALILAKTNMGEYASRYVGSGFGVIRNAYDPLRNPSGSSGGTGVGIAANLGMIGIGEDTGGSIRGPAAVASLVGLRPTLQLVSRFGMMPANPTTDTMGPMTRTVMDAAILLGVIAGYDPNDPVTAHAFGHVPDSYTDGLALDGLAGARIGVIRDAMDGRVDPSSEGFQQVRARIERCSGRPPRTRRRGDRQRGHRGDRKHQPGLLEQLLRDRGGHGRLPGGACERPVQHACFDPAERPGHAVAGEGNGRSAGQDDP